MAYLLVRSSAFILQQGYPSGYWYDLGFHLIATSIQAATIRSLPDFMDCIGWAAWGDVPQFSYNPMMTSAVLISLVKLGANANLAVKLLMVAQVWLAVLSMAALYKVFRHSWTWAVLSGLIYSMFPATALQISSNLDLGFSVALAPLALAVGIRLIRNIGNLGLPLAGAICGFVGQGFAIENLFVVSLPLYAILLALSFEKRKLAVWVPCAAAGALATLSVGLYCILPTLGSSHVVSSPAARVVANQSDVFGESIGALWHGILGESTLAPWKEFNVTTLLWSTSLSLTLLWAAAIFYAVRTSRKSASETRVAAIVALLLFLSLGSAVPFGATFWGIITRVPLLQFLRTPDRLVVVPFIFVVLYSVSALQALWRCSNRFGYRRARYLTAASVLLVGLSFAYFDFQSGVLIVRETVDYRLPVLDRTDAAALEQPAPLASYALVNQGSVLDSPLYGMGVPERVIAQDLLSRYASGPAHAVGVLRRAGINTVLTTPNWALDTGSRPDLGVAYAASRWMHPTFSWPAGPDVWTVRSPARDVGEVGLACFHGGPGVLDQMFSLPMLSHVAISTDGRDCRVSIDANVDPRDASPIDSLASWRGEDLSPGLPARDNDYPFLTTNVLLARAWYRDAIQGDSPAFATPTVQIPDGWRAARSIAVKTAGRYMLNARFATSSDACIMVSVDGNDRAQSGCAAASPGLHWVTIPLWLSSGRHALDFSIQSVPTNLLFLDGISLTSAAAQPRTWGRPGGHTIIYSTDWLMTAAGQMRPLWFPAGVYRVGWYAPDGREISNKVAADGRAAAGSFEFAASGFHQLEGPPAGAGLLVAYNSDLVPIQPPRNSLSSKLSATKWSVTVKSPGTIRATVLNDGNWILKNDANQFAGFDCDIVDTCFSEVPRGRFILAHRWPAAVTLGIAASATTWMSVIVIAVIAIRRGLKGHRPTYRRSDALLS